MRPESLDLPDDDVELRKLEFRQRERHHQDQLKAVRQTGIGTFVGVVVTVVIAMATLLSQGGQFEASLRTSEYREIVAGLDSDAVAVQDSSMRRLVDYVEDEDNFDPAEDQRDAYRNAIQTLTAFIVDQSNQVRGTGLSEYQNPQPIIVPRAMNHLRSLIGDPMGAEVIDISGADLHGAWLPNFSPAAHIVAAGVDFRRATLAELDLTATDSPSTLNSSFFTCAGLVGADFGNASLVNADLTGANLRGADLSNVTGLEEEQLNGTSIGEHTRLPPGIELELRVGWREADPERCYEMVNKMTGMRGSQGYYSQLPCPETEAAARSAEFEPAWKGPVEDLVRACRLRAGKGD